MDLAIKHGAQHKTMARGRQHTPMAHADGNRVGEHWDVRGRARDFLNVFNHMSQRRNHQKIEPLDITSNRCTHVRVCARALGGVRVVLFGRACSRAPCGCVAAAVLWLHRLWGAA